MYRSRVSESLAGSRLLLSPHPNPLPKGEGVYAGNPVATVRYDDSSSPINTNTSAT